MIANLAASKSNALHNYRALTADMISVAMLHDSDEDLDHINAADTGSSENNLPGPFEDDHDHSTSRLRPKWWNLMKLTLIFAGVQFVWTIEMGYGTPYLLSFGMSKSVLTLAWLAGPLSGLLIQPLVGAWSDKCSSPIGRRRPFIQVGCLAIICSLMLISCARELASMIRMSEVTLWRLETLPNAESEFFCDLQSEGYGETLAAVVAVIGFYLLDFSINAVQASSRSLIVDVLATADQSSGHSYASLMIALGNIVGYLAGSFDLVRWLSPWISYSDTQMKSLSFIASALIIICCTVTCLSIKEYPLFQSSLDTGPCADKWWTPLKQVMRPHKLPKRLRRIFAVQFMSWMAWFPFSFFSTEFIKELWLHEQSGWPDSVEAVRMGSLAMFMFSVVSLLASILLPYVASNECCGRIKLKYIWSGSQIWFCALLLAASFSVLYMEAAVIVALCGISMAVSLWIPFATVGAVLSSREDLRQSIRSSIRSSLSMMNHGKDTDSHIDNHYNQRNPASDSADIDYRWMLRQLNDQDTMQTGVLLGLHNVSVVMPQFLSSMICSGIFAMVSQETGMQWIWRFASMSSLVAALLALKVKTA